MKHNKILITFLATIVLASHGLEGMKKKDDIPTLFETVANMIIEKNIEGIKKFVTQPISHELITYVNPKTEENLLHIAVRSDNPEMVANILKLVNTDNFITVILQENKKKQNPIQIAETGTTEESLNINSLIIERAMKQFPSHIQLPQLQPAIQQPPHQQQPAIPQPIVQQTAPPVPLELRQVPITSYEYKCIRNSKPNPDPINL